jgi:hypothetical protein
MKNDCQKIVDISETNRLLQKQVVVLLILTQWYFGMNIFKFNVKKWKNTSQSSFWKQIGHIQCNV